MSVSVTFNSSKVSARLLALANTFPQAAAVALNEVAEVTMTDAKERTPVQYGRLKASGNVATYATTRSLRARLVFGTEYCVWVHERLELRHKVGEAKFLERAMSKTALTFAADIKAKIMQILNG